MPEELPWPLSLGFPTLGLFSAAYALVPFVLVIALAGANLSRPAGAPQRPGRPVAARFGTLPALALIHPCSRSAPPSSSQR